MASKSQIEWTEQTWNPTTGCTKVSPGCKHCYAEVMAKRLHAMKVAGYENSFDFSMHESRLNQPLLRKKPTVYFVNSMSDIFHEDIADDFLDMVFSVINCTPFHTYQILTKRASRAERYFEEHECPKNVWLGVSVEDVKYGVPRIDSLRRVAASIRFLSVEPLLEDIGTINLEGMHWVIVGGESGPSARPMKMEWVDSIRQQCELSGVAFFFKQWGGWGADGVKRSKSKNGRLLHGKIWDDRPQRSHGAIA
jgi:protein gp37